VMQHFSGQTRCIFDHFSSVSDHYLCSKKNNFKGRNA